MAISFLLKIGTTDLTGHVVQNTWNVNKLPVYKTYKDANEETHKRFLRDKVSGSFQLVFKDLTEYAAFNTLINSKRSASSFTVPCTVYDNISGTQISINAFLDYDLTVKQSAGLDEYIEPFDVKIEEQ
jgi:hypothetical protein